MQSIALTPKNTDVAWFAGIFDGEGSVIVERMGGGAYHLKLSIKMTNLPAIQRIQSIWGLGRIDPHRENDHQQQWCWAAGASNALHILRDSLSYLTVKKVEAELAIAYQIKVSETGKKHNKTKHRRLLGEMCRATLIKTRLETQVNNFAPKVLKMCKVSL